MPHAWSSGSPRPASGRRRWTRADPRCCGLDIHTRLVVACRVVPGPNGAARKEVRSFGTTTAAIEGLASWLADGEVTHVAMEATGVYWKPMLNVLEGRFTLLLANAQHIKRVPGGRPTSRTASGSRTCCAMGCCRRASCRIGRSGNCGS